MQMGGETERGGPRWDVVRRVFSIEKVTNEVKGLASANVYVDTQTKTVVSIPVFAICLDALTETLTTCSSIGGGSLY